MALPPIFYYNCEFPHLIMEELKIRTSKRVNPGVGGVSMSSWKELSTSGPFKIAFKFSPWFEQFKPCIYRTADMVILPGDEGRIRNSMFRDEQEWWSPHSVAFQYVDVMYIMRMTNAPCVLGTRKLGMIISELKSKYFPLYQEEAVNDPYLKGS